MSSVLAEYDLNPPWAVETNVTTLKVLGDDMVGSAVWNTSLLFTGYSKMNITFHLQEELAMQENA